MRSSWTQTLRRLAAGCVISTGMAWSSAMCYAVTLASDSASDPIYANGWEAGQNGGTGFTPWNFESGYFCPFGCNTPAMFYDYGNKGPAHIIDDGNKSGTPQFTSNLTSNPFNDVGSPAINGSKRTWAIAQQPSVQGDGQGVPRSGRGFPTLQPGQTLSVVVDNPAKTAPFYKGYWINFNGGTDVANDGINGGVHGNICYAGRPCYYIPDPAHPGQYIAGAAPKPELVLWNWEDNGVFGFGYERWFWGDADPQDTDTGLFATDAFNTHPNSTTSNGGMRIDLAMTSATDYSVAITRLSNPGTPAFTQTGTIKTPTSGGNPIGIDWIQIDNVGNPTDHGAEGPGDFNRDGRINGGDYVTWRKNNGTNGALTNDNGLGTPVGPGHYTLWRNNYGFVSGPPTEGTDFYIRSLTITAPGAGVIFGNVPEPGTFVYIVAAAAGGLGLVGRRRS